MKIIESIPIQKIHAFGETDDLICNFTVEEIKAPTYSIIHTMSRLWLVNSGCAKVLINNKEYCIKKGDLISVLPWQITNIIEVKSTLQIFVVEYYFDKINEIIKSVYNTGKTYLSISQSLEKSSLATFDETNYKEVHKIFYQIKECIEKPNLQISEYSNLYITNKLVELILLLLCNIQDTKKKLPDDKSEILRYMYMHLSEKITISLLATKFYMSESMVRAYIKKTTGLSFFELLNEMRVGRRVYL